MAGNHGPMMNYPVKVGIIGGSGLDDPDILDDRQEKVVNTPFGKPSDALITGKIKNVDCVLLARHGRKHDISPSNINFRGNIWALKEEKCTHILATTACGSLKEEYKPGDLVFLDQFLDRTFNRSQTFFDGSPSAPKGICHLPMAYPFCDKTRQLLAESASELGLIFHSTGTNITVEGPRFSTVAESKMFRGWGAEVINMTTVPEVVLANEAALCYASIALVTDYDCWKENGESVGVEMVMQTMKTNAIIGTKLILDVIPKIAAIDWSDTLRTRQETVKSSTMM